MEKLSEIGAIVLGTMLKVNKSILSTGNQSLVTENVSFHLEKLSDGRLVSPPKCRMSCEFYN